MPQAKITLAGTKADNTAFGPAAGSQLDAKINTLVNLDNLNTGGELTFTWSILDQPPGAADALSSVSVQSPFFTPKKEGSYLLRLLVNQGLPTEQEDRVVLAIAQLKTRERMPAAGETTEADTSDGWATSMNSLLRRVDTLLSDPGILVGVNGSGGTLSRGAIVRAPATDILKATLPGAETVPSFLAVSAATLSTIDELLCVIEGTPAGAPGVPGTGSAENRLMRVRYIGRISALTIAGPAPAAGDVLFVNDAGAISSIQGTLRRRIGSAMSAGSPADVWFNGVGGADIDLPAITEPFVTNGVSALPNAFRIDGNNAGSRTTATGPFQVHTGDTGVVTMVLRRFSGAGLAIQQWQTEGGTVLAQVTNSGHLSLTAGLTVTAGVVTFNTGWNTASATDALIGQTGRLRFFEVGLDQIRFENGAGVPIWTIQTSASAFWWKYGTGGTATTPFNFQYGNPGDDTFLIEGDSVGDGSGTYIAVLLRVNGLALTAQVGTSTNHPLYFKTNNTDKWQVTAAGVLASIGGPRAIQSVLDPATSQDAATKIYADTHLHGGNLVINGNFDFWQRGATLKTIAGTNKVRSHIAAANVFDRQYGADRWYSDVTHITTAASGTTVEMTRQPSGLATSPFCARVRSVGTAGVTQFEVVHEIDRDMIPQLRGKLLTLQFKLRADATFIANGNSSLVRLATGTDVGGNVVRKNYTGAVNLIGTPSITNSSLTGSFQTFTYTAATPVPSDATEMAFLLSMAGSGAYDHYIEITEVMVVPQTAAPAAFIRAGGTAAEELTLCQRYYEKSYEVGTIPGTSGTFGQDGAHTTYWNSGIATGAIQMPITHPRFLVKKWRPIAGTSLVTLYRRDATDTVGTWIINPGTFTHAVISTGVSNQCGFLVYANEAKAAVGATTDQTIIEGHWAISADIGDAV